MAKKSSKTRVSGILPDYRRAGQQRLAVAEFLCASQFGYLDAMYLSGYGVECAMKAVIVQATPQKKWVELREEFRGQKAYNFDFLKGLLETRGVMMPREVVANLRTFATWSTDLRYECGRGSYDDLWPMLVSGKAIQGWAEGCWCDEKRKARF